MSYYCVLVIQSTDMAKSEISKRVKAETKAFLVELGLQRARVREQPVTTPNTHYTESARVADNGELMIADVLDKLQQLKDVSTLLYHCACLQFEHGLRISEVIGIRSYHITSSGSILIKAKKGSVDRVVYSQEVASYMLDCRRKVIDPFVELDRYYVYREYSKVGLCYIRAGDTRGKVTHLFRHLIAKVNNQAGIDISITQNKLGHKNVKSTKHYG